MRVIETVIEERKNAEAKFEDAVASGTSMPVMATYATIKSVETMKVNLGNFPPRTKTVLTCYMCG